MRIYYLIILLSISLAGLTGVLTFSIEKSKYASSHEIKQIQGLLEQYKSEHVPVGVLDLSSYFLNLDRFSLVSENYVNLSSSKKPIQNLATFTYKDCQNTQLAKIDPMSFNKLKIWNDFDCGIISNFPDGYFLKAPYMHPSGKSYVLLAYEKRHPFVDVIWIQEMLPFFHISELALLKKDVVKPPSGGVGASFVRLARFKKSQINEILKMRPLFYARSKVYIKDSNQKLGHGFNYLIFKSDEFTQFMAARNYLVDFHSSASGCFFAEGQICWHKNLSGIVKGIEFGSTALLLGLLFLIAFSGWLLVKRVAEQKREGLKKKFALEVLTHEFRTPVTNLILQIEKMHKVFHKQCDEVKQLSPVLSGEVYKLQRLVEETDQYLRFKDSKRLIDFKYPKIESVNVFVQSHLDFDDTDILFIGLDEDLSANLDNYWFGVCLKNLINNAIKHGEAPIEVCLQKESNNLVVSVRDGGREINQNLKRLSEDFYKGQHSDGLGLGLSIVRQVVKEMNGEMSLMQNPTCFKIIFKGCL